MEHTCRFGVSQLYGRRGASYWSREHSDLGCSSFTYSAVGANMGLE
jgi:hypothetical protein